MSFEAAARVVTPDLPVYIPHCPTVRQQATLDLDQREVLYGGAAGGGKTDLLLMAALLFVEVRQYAAVIFRRTFAQLSRADGLLARAQEWLAPTDAKPAETVNGFPTRWDFPSGAVLEFEHMQHESDKFNHQGAAYDFIGFDELTQFSESQYRYLFSRLRRLEGSTIPPRVRSTSNPGGVGHDWVQTRWAIPRETVPLAHVGPKGRVFIPAKLADNPHLDRAAYVESLMELDPVTREQLLNGDWSVRDQGGVLRREWFEIVDAAPARPERKVRYWDMAATEQKPGADPDWTVGCLLSKQGGTYYVEDVRRFRRDPAAVEAIVCQTADLDGRGTKVVLEQEPGSSGKTVIAAYLRALAGFTVSGDRVTGSKTSRAGPFASQAQAGNVKLVRGAWIADFLDECDAFPGGAHDDQVDAASGAFTELARGMSWAALNAEVEEAA